MIEEKLFPAIIEVKKAFTEKLSRFPDKFFFGCIHYAIVEEAMKEVGFEPDWNNSDFNHSGDIDYWVVFRSADKDFCYLLSGSTYCDRSEIEKLPKTYKLGQLL